MKKMRFRAILMSLLVLMLLGKTTTTWAEPQFLFKVSPKTYVTTDHPGGYFADKYYGEASVCSQDSFPSPNGIYFYKWTRVTYNVQGEIYSATAMSKGLKDPKQHIKRIVVYDKWNNGPKTQVYANYGIEEDRGPNLPYSIDDDSAK